MNGLPNLGERLKTYESLCRCETRYGAAENEAMNQLNAVLNAVELLRQQIGGGEDREALLDAIGQGSLCLARLAVNQADLLSCLRDEGRPNLIAVDLAEQIRTLVEVMRPYVETQHCALVFRRDGPVYLRVEPHMADRVLLNLVAEAVTRGRRGGTIAITLEHSTGGALLKVQDDGYAISLERLSSLQTALCTEKTPGELEMCLVGEYCRRQNWKLEWSSCGNETCFSMRIPQEERCPADLVMASQTGQDGKQQLWREISARMTLVRRAPGADDAEYAVKRQPNRPGDAAAEAAICPVCFFAPQRAAFAGRTAGSCFTLRAFYCTIPINMIGSGGV